MKGITPVIAVVLLLMITVALIGFAFVWFQGIMTGVTEQVQNSTLSELEKQGMQIKLESAASDVNINGAIYDVVYIRNRGTRNIPLERISVYFDGVLAITKNTEVCNWTSSYDLAVGTVIGMQCYDNQFSSGDRVKATSPGTAQDIIIVP